MHTPLHASVTDLCGVSISKVCLQAATLKKLAAEAKTVLDSFWGTGRRQMLCLALIDDFLTLTVSSCTQKPCFACRGHITIICS